MDDMDVETTTPTSTPLSEEPTTLAVSLPDIVPRPTAPPPPPPVPNPTVALAALGTIMSATVSSAPTHPQTEPTTKIASAIIPPTAPTSKIASTIIPPTAPTKTLASTIVLSTEPATATIIASTTIVRPTVTAAAGPSAVAPVTVQPNTRTLNSNGFENGNWYIIRNAGDNNVVHLEGKIFVSAAEDDDKKEFQLFQAIKQPNGAYRIKVKSQASNEVTLFWDYLPHRKLLMQKKLSSTDKYHQNWTSEPVPGYYSLYLVQSGTSRETQFCLKNVGIGRQIQLVPKDEKTVGDSFTHWYLELQD